MRVPEELSRGEKEADGQRSFKEAGMSRKTSKK